MSRNRKNNHYHYAEKFEAGRSRRGSGKTAYMPFKAVIISLIVLVMFGFVCTTFAAYVTDNEPEYDPDAPGIISEIRNLKASREIAYTGGNVDLASTGATWSFSGGYIYFDNKVTNWSTTYFYLVIGKSSYSSVYQMTALGKTKYYYCALPTSGWGDAEYMAVIGSNSTWGSGSWGSGNLSNASKYSAAYTSGLSSSSGQRYIFTPGSSTNGFSLSLANNDNMTTVTLSAHACYTTNGTSYTQDNNTGGTVNVSGYYMTSNTAVSSLSAAGAGGSASYNSVRTTSDYKAQFVASAANGYNFQGWYTAKTGGTLVSSDATYNYDVNSGNKEIYARFIKTYTVSISKYPSAYTGTAPTVTGGGNTAASITVEAGTSVTMNSNVSNTGITCTFRNGGEAGTVISGAQTITSNLSIAACYTLATPTISKFSYATTVEGAAAITPSKTASSGGNPAGTLSYSYSSQTGGTGPTNSSSLNVTTGAFSATVAGTYKVLLTVTDTCSGLTATATKDATVTVKPAPVTGISYTVTGEDSGAGTSSEPWKVPINSTVFSITSYIPDDGSRDPNYLYTWTRTDGTYLISDGTITAGSGSVTESDVYTVTDTATSGTTTADVIHNTMLADTNGYIYKVAVTKTRNNVTSDPFYVTFYYGVTRDFLVVNHFDFRQFNSSDVLQKIYAEDSGIDYIDADYNAGGEHFHTILNFSKDNITPNKVAVWTPQNTSFSISSGEFAGTHTPLPNDSDHWVDTLIEHISTVARNNANLMATAGPKWFKAYVDDYQNANIGAVIQPLHTTVGTSSTVANRPIYFVDQALATGVNVNSRVMAFYLTESDNELHYQTGQKVTGRSDTYRFYIPADATYISFAYVANNNYVLPSVSGNTFSYSVYTNHEVLKAWTAAIDLNSETNVGKTTYTATAYTEDSVTHIYNYSGSMTTLN